MLSTASYAVDRSESLRVDGTLTIYYPPESWKNDPRVGSSAPLPYSLVLSASKKFRSHIDLGKFNNGANPISTGFAKSDGVCYSYMTAYTSQRLPNDPPIGLGSIADSIFSVGSNRFDEILYLASHREIISVWSNQLANLDIFIGLRNESRGEIFVKEFSEGLAYRWQLWRSAKIDGQTYEWCMYSMQVINRLSSVDSIIYPHEIQFEIRLWSGATLDPLNSQLYIGYNYVAQQTSHLKEFPLTVFIDENPAKSVLVKDSRRGISNSGIEYHIRGKDEIPFETRSPIVFRTSQQYDKEARKSSRALITFVLFTAALFCLLEFHRRKNKKTKNE